MRLLLKIIQKPVFIEQIEKKISLVNSINSIIATSINYRLNTAGLFGRWISCVVPEEDISWWIKL